MKSPRYRPPTKENSNDNFFRESPKRTPTRKCPSCNFSKIPLPLTKSSKLRQEPKFVPLEEVEQVEREIEARLRLKMRVELSHRFHQIQDKYDGEIMNTSSSLSSSFFDSYSIFSSTNSKVESNDPNMSTADIEQDIYEEEERQKQLLEERKLKQAELKSLQAEFSKLLSTQAQLQEEQNELSKHIGEAYLMNSDLTLEVNSLKEQNQIKEIFDETPDTFDGDNDQIDFGLSPPRYSIDTNTSQRIVNEQVEKTSPKKQNANLNGSWLDLIPPGQSRNSSLSTGASYITQETSFLDEGTVDDFDHPPLNTVEIENVESVPHQEPLSESEDGNDTELPKELFRAPYRIKIPVRPPKK